MDVKEASLLFNDEMNIRVVNIERCGAGIGNYVFIVSTTDSKYVLRCSKEKQAYDQTIRWLSELEICNIPIPKILRVGEYSNYAYIILSYLEGNDLGHVYSKLNSNEKKRIAKDVIEIQNRVSGLKITIPSDWNWNSFIDEMLVRAYERISVNNFFDVLKIEEVRLLQNELQKYINYININ